MAMNPDLHQYDAMGADQNKCAGGTANHLANSLSGVHKAVEVRAVSRNDLINYFTSKLYEVIEAKYKAEQPQASTVEEKTSTQSANPLDAHLSFWHSMGRISDEFKQIIDNKFAEIIKNKAIEAGYNRDFSDAEIDRNYHLAISGAQINKQLKTIAEAVLLKSAAKSKNYYYLGNQGHVSYLNYLFQNDPNQFRQVVEKALSGLESFKTLMRNDYAMTLSHLNPQAREALTKLILESTSTSATIVMIACFDRKRIPLLEEYVIQNLANELELNFAV